MTVWRAWPETRQPGRNGRPFSSQAVLSRRSAVVWLGGAAGLFAVGALTGCGAQAASNTHVGYSDDTEVKDDPVTVKILADDRLKRAPSTNNGYGRLEAYFLKYQSQSGRGDVTFKVKYLTSAEMLHGATDGFSEECDGIVALEDTVQAGVDAGVLYDGRGGVSVRTLGSVLNETLVIVKAKGSSTVMPPAKTLTGEDAVDGSITQLQSLPDFGGRIAIATDALPEGVMANQALAKDGMYTEESGVGGTYADSIRDKVQICDSVEDVVSAVASGDGAIGFLTLSCLWGDYPTVESLYSPLHSRMTYSGASTVDAAEGGVCRDFFEYLTRQV